MIVYLDVVFFINCLADAAALYITARLSGLPLRRRRLLLAAALGGAYGAFCALPVIRSAAAFLPQLAIAAALVRLAFGRQEMFLRRFLLFFMLSCTMGGAMLAFGRLVQDSDGLELLRALDWRVFFLAGGTCFLLLSVVFRGGARHAVAGQLCRGTVELGGRRANITVLLDTGHTLADTITGSQVLTVYNAALAPLWTDQERDILACLGPDGAARCLERLADSRFRLLPYQAVGVEGGLLLCFRAGCVQLDGRRLGPLTVAISPTPVSDGGGCTALWGGKMEESHAA